MENGMRTKDITRRHCTALPKNKMNNIVYACLNCRIHDLLWDSWSLQTRLMDWIGTLLICKSKEAHKSVIVWKLNGQWIVWPDILLIKVLGCLFWQLHVVEWGFSVTQTCSSRLLQPIAHFHALYVVAGAIPFRYKLAMFPILPFAKPVMMFVHGLYLFLIVFLNPNQFHITDLV